MLSRAERRRMPRSARPAGRLRRKREQTPAHGRIEPQLSPQAAARRLRQARYAPLPVPDRVTPSAWLLVAAVALVMAMVAIYPE